MGAEQLFFLDRAGRIRCHSKGRACGDRDTSKFRNKWGLPGDKPAGTLHHMVPWGQLWRVLEASMLAIRTSGDTAILDALLPVCYSHTRLDGHSARLATAIRALGQPGQRGALTPRGTELSVDIPDEYSPNDGEQLAFLAGETAIFDLVNHWCWMPGNLFLGSSTRCDDPGDFGFDHPPKDVRRHGSNISTEGATSFESRVTDLFAFYTLMRSKSDEALTADAGDLVAALGGLQQHRLWTPFQLTEEKIGHSFKARGDKYYVADPLILNSAMQANYDERMTVLAPPYKGDYEKYLKATRAR